MAKFTVIGTSKICGVEHGGVVDIDGDVFNIPALIAGGHIEPFRAPAKARPAAKPTSDENGSDEEVV